MTEIHFIVEEAQKAVSLPAPWDHPRGSVHGMARDELLQRLLD
jgi:hypothetical protein